MNIWEFSFSQWQPPACLPLLVLFQTHWENGGKPAPKRCLWMPWKALMFETHCLGMPKNIQTKALIKWSLWISKSSAPLASYQWKTFCLLTLLFQSFSMGFSQILCWVKWTGTLSILLNGNLRLMCTCMWLTICSLERQSNQLFHRIMK
jgi:hypothetical protein